MSFYRTLLAAVAAVVIASPVFADDNATTTQNPSSDNNSKAVQLSDNAAAQQQGTSEEQTKINLNKATIKELMKVKGLSVNKAKSIVAYRKKHGDFKSVDELKGVKGFKKMKDDQFKGIQDQLSVE